MSATEGFYSIIQYVPDLDRSEGVNVGVALLSPTTGRAHVRLAETNEMVRRRFPGYAFDDARLGYAKSSLKSRLESRTFETLKDFERFAAALGNNLTLLPLRSTLVRSVPEELDALMTALVHDARTTAQRERHEVEALREEYLTPLFAGAKVHWETREVMIPVAQRPIKVLFAYRNGAMNYVKGLRFGDDLSSALENAQKVAAQGALLARFPIELDGERVQQRLIVLAHFGDLSMREKIDAVLRVFDVEMEVTDNIKAFAERVRRDAH